MTRHGLDAWEAAWLAASDADREECARLDAVRATEAKPMAEVIAAQAARAVLLRALRRALVSGEVIARGYFGEVVALRDMPPPLWDRLDLDAESGIARDRDTRDAVATGLRFLAVAVEVEALAEPAAPAAAAAPAPATETTAASRKRPDPKPHGPSPDDVGRAAYLAFVDEWRAEHDPDNLDHLPLSTGAAVEALRGLNVPRAAIRGYQREVWNGRKAKPGPRKT